MSITWSGTLGVADAAGRLVTVKSTPRGGADDKEPHAVGAACGVVKPVVDHPHRSDDGH